MNVYDFMILAQQSDSGSVVAALVGQIINLAIVVLILASLWQIFVKMGEDGWKSIIPIYNYVVLLQVVGRPVWWVILFFVPIANLVVLFLVWKDVAEGFGKGTGYAVGMLFLSFIFLPMLAFGDAQWMGGKKKMGY
jgi:hypothetical protein